MRRARRCEFQPLESRLFLAATPGQVLTADVRQTLLDNLSLRPSLASSLKHKLRTEQFAAFDQQLLDYVRAEGRGKFFFDTDADTVDDYADYIVESLSPGADLQRADRVLDDLYPEQDSSGEYTVRLPDDVDWDNTRYSSNPETVHALNRHSHWYYLAMAHRLTGEDAYADKLVSQLGDWSADSPSPDEGGRGSPQWERLNAAVRGESWAWTYSLMLSSPRWTKEANTLFLAKVLEHGRYLYEVEPAALTSNHAVSQAQGLLYLAQLFPEFSAARTWERHARDLLFRSMDSQLFDDGSHAEQSPGYSAIILGWLVETKLLDARNGDVWPAARTAKLTAAIDAFHEILTPDGATPAIGDSFRRPSMTLWLKSNLAQGETRWPSAKPRTRDAWLLGPDAVRPFESNPVTPPLGDRPRAYALPQSGNYIMRSGSGADARQVTFDAGPRGGTHGHFDLLAFELFGYGRPLIADPGPFQYDTSRRRAWAVSTPAHNTVSIDGLNHAPLEGADNGGFKVDAWNVRDDYVQVTAHHDAYTPLRGAPVVSRSIWFDYDDTMLVVDWVEGGAAHDLRSSFLIPGASTSRDLAAGWITSNNDDGGNVKVQAILQPGQRATYRTKDVFTSSDPPPNHHDPATQIFVYQTGSFAVFATLITTYDGDSPPDVTASLLSTPAPGRRVSIRLSDGDGNERDVTFTPPGLRLGPSAATRGSFSDIAFDARGNLHLAYFDRDDQNLKYSVRDPRGTWARVETIDNAPLSGYEPSIAVNDDGRVGVAYTDASHGDLKFALLDGRRWTVQTVDAKGSTGHYPSLAFGRAGEAVITYYDKTQGDLRIASGTGGKWTRRTLDAGSAGTRDVGRFSSLALDPSSGRESRWAIAYEDTGGGRYLYAVQGKLARGDYDGSTGYTTFIVADAPKLGGYTSLAFDSGNRPHVSFYDSSITGLRYARSAGDSSGGVRFSASTVIEIGAAGYYSNLYFNESGHPTILYFDRTRSRAMRAVFADNRWSTSPLAPGGREINVARFNGTVAYTNLDEDADELEVLFL
jgi:hypothetical protein